MFAQFSGDIAKYLPCALHLFREQNDIAHGIDGVAQ